MKFEIFKGSDNQWYFHLRAANGEIVLQSEGYVRKAGAQNGIKVIKRSVRTAIVETIN